MIDCRPETATLLARPEPTECRIEWAINNGSGHGDWFPISQRRSLLTWVDDGNSRYGPGTHWIMTR